MLALLKYWQIGAGAVLGAMLAAGPLYLMGQSAGEDNMRLKMAKEAVDRVEKLEKNNANFRKLSDRDRCLVFMRDSGLPDSACE